jgi:hypothetical protein
MLRLLPYQVRQTASDGGHFFHCCVADIAASGIMNAVILACWVLNE